jgi:ribosomal protein S18 acetylase RimI-like enzyme
MLEAYRGTPDDGGEGPAEARAEVDRTFDGGYGSMWWEASFAVDFDDRAALASVSIVTSWRGMPLLAFSCTHPAAQRRGLAGRLIRESARALARAGHVRLELAVTPGNTPAERLYEKLGFVDIEPA